MKESFVQKIWSAIVPPDPYRPDTGVKRSSWRMFWESIKPPPAVKKEKKPLTAQQKKMLRFAVYAAGILALAGMGVGAYYYIDAAPSRAEATFQAGMKLMSPGKYQEAIRKFDSAIGTWDKHARAYLNRGVAKQTLGDTEGALDDFERAAAADPSLAEAHTARGLILRSRKNVAGAIDAFTKSISLNPTVDGYYQRGQLFEVSGEHQKALADFDKAIALDRSAPFVYEARSMTRRALGDTTGSAEDRSMAQAILNKR
jgi:tetratricopeptide (TPR) repeat protein